MIVEKPRIIVLNITLLNVVSTPKVRNMPLSLDNDLAAAIFRFVATSDDKSHSRVTLIIAYL